MQLFYKLLSNALMRYLLSNKHNPGFREFKVIGIWSLILLLSYKIWSMRACSKSVDALRFVWLRCPNNSCRPLHFHCGSLRNNCLHGKAYVCFVPAKKKLTFKSINQFQPNLTGVEVLKTLYERFWVASFISLKQLFVPF